LLDANKRNPVLIGNEGSYLALSDGGDSSKQNYCPFLRPSTVGDNPAHTFLDGSGNRWIFDISSYLTRFSVATPDIVILELLTNDIFLDASGTAWPTWIQNGLEIAVPNILALSESVRVILPAPIRPYSIGADRQHAEQIGAIRQIMKYVRDLDEDRVQFVPWYWQISKHTNWPLVTQSIDASTGLLTCGVDDDKHFGLTNLQFCVDAMAACIMSA
jgi:hypothetical protein